MSPLGCGCGGAKQHEYLVVTADGQQHVVRDRYEAINLVRTQGGTWQERIAGSESNVKYPAR